MTSTGLLNLYALAFPPKISQENVVLTQNILLATFLATYPPHPLFSLAATLVR